ncbi:hypothetical protein [Thermanaeromonas sp.]|uniref:hypothetical protein n=1 Tax=Thermanaeromonas sp. TaxID=2003697 RepID=UPI0026182844|nr:hypothetical protein [Thermanaeromonas sp.]
MPAPAQGGSKIERQPEGHTITESKQQEGESLPAAYRCIERPPRRRPVKAKAWRRHKACRLDQPV